MMPLDPIRPIRRLTVPALAAALCLSACGGGGSHDSDHGDPGDLSARAHIEACGDSLTMIEQMDILNGSLILASRHSRDADWNNAFLGRFLLGFILNGVDFDALDKFELTFSDGVYRYGRGSHFATIAFVFTKDYQDFRAGDTIPYNLFELKSYVPEFDVSLSGVDIKKRGPLYDLADVKWRMAGLTPKFTVRFPDLHTIGASVGTLGWYEHAYDDTTTEAPGDSLRDSLKLAMATPAENFFVMKQRFDAKTFELDYDATEYHSKYYDVDQVFGGSAIRIYEDAKSEWKFDGKYHAMLKSGEHVFYVEGYLSNHDDNYTKYYCDADHKDLMGTAKHDKTLLFGLYHPRTGGYLPYLILAF
jgi:hypothetical protein